MLNAVGMLLAALVLLACILAYKVLKVVVFWLVDWTAALLFNKGPKARNDLGTTGDPE